MTAAASPGLGGGPGRSRSLSNQPLQRPMAEGAHGPRVDPHSASGRLVRTSHSAIAAERHGVGWTERGTIMGLNREHGCQRR